MRGREKRVTEGSGVRRGRKVDAGPVGRGGFNGNGQNPPSPGYRNVRAGKGLGGASVLVLLLMFFLGRGNLSGLLSNIDGMTENSGTGYTDASGDINGASDMTGYGSSLESLFGNTGNGIFGNSYLTGSSSWTGDSENSSDGRNLILNENVSEKARDKYTVLKEDSEVLLMVYMCGTDLESGSHMATSDLNEMLKADIKDSVHLIVYTGGCKKWQNNVVSSSENGIYEIKNNSIKLLKSEKSRSMTDPDTLTEFVKWASKEYPSERKCLIFWDHGGGSASGYGYDEKFPSSGSMDLKEINTAIKNTGEKFDFIGFDACLMATLENALSLSDYSDYIIASEETEPGTGWYYTDFLSLLSEKTDIKTTELGKKIIDDFTEKSEEQARGQKTTLSLVDLSELSQTVPEAFSGFSEDIGNLLSEDIGSISKARKSSREFAQTSKIDQVDICDFADRIEGEAAEKLSKAVREAVKYNRTSKGITNAFGLSVYFPMQNLKNVDSMTDTYEELGIDSGFSKAVKGYALALMSGEAVSSESAFPAMGQLLSQEGFSNQTMYSSIGEDMIKNIILSLLNGSISSSGISPRSIKESGLSGEALLRGVLETRFDPSELFWTDTEEGKILKISEDNLGKLRRISSCMFYDDGEGYIDLGEDALYEYSSEGYLLGKTDKTWISIEGHPCAFYHLDTAEDGENYTITGRVPALLNGKYVNLLLTFDNDSPYGYISGAITDYKEGETETVAKADTELKKGDRIELLCDYYPYDESSGKKTVGEEIEGTYILGEAFYLPDISETEISNTYVGDGNILYGYVLTDDFNTRYFTPLLEES